MRRKLTDEDRRWQARLRLFLADGSWQPEWGPQPTQAGCLVPMHLLDPDASPAAAGKGVPGAADEAGPKEDPKTGGGTPANRAPAASMASRQILTDFEVELLSALNLLNVHVQYLCEKIGGLTEAANRCRALLGGLQPAAATAERVDDDPAAEREWAVERAREAARIMAEERAVAEAADRRARLDKRREELLGLRLPISAVEAALREEFAWYRGSTGSDAQAAAHQAGLGNGVAGAVVLTEEERAQAFREKLTALNQPDPAPAPPSEGEEWGKRLELWRSHRMWMPDWGAEPGSTGCRVPREMLLKTEGGWL